MYAPAYPKSEVVAFNNEKNKNAFKNWKTAIDEQGDKLLNFYLSNRNVSMPDNFDDLQELDEQYKQILNEVLEDRNGHLLFWLMNLQEYNDGTDWLDKLGEVLSLDDDELPDKLHEESGGELLAKVISELDKVIYIDVPDGVEVYLSDWKYEDEFGHKFTFEVAMPSDANIKTLDINVYSFLASWHQRQMEVLYMLMPEWDADGDYEANIKYEMCETNQGVEPFFYLLSKAMQTVQHIYEANNLLSLATHRGSLLVMMPLTESQAQLRPTYRFMSETNECYPGTFQTCIDECMNHEHLAKCSCYPWNLYYLNMGSKKDICEKPCEIGKNHCEYFCEDRTIHPCDFTVYDIERVRNDMPIIDIEELIPLYSLKISVTSAFNHVKFVETYAYTLVTFMSEIGGLIDFWVGVNLIGIIHLFIYLLTQCCNVSKSGTGTTIQQLQGEKPHVDTANEPTNAEMSKVMASEHEFRCRLNEIEKQQKAELGKVYVEIRKLKAEIGKLSK